LAAERCHIRLNQPIALEHMVAAARDVRLIAAVEQERQLWLKAEQRISGCSPQC
jgi:hypothetical protein